MSADSPHPTDQGIEKQSAKPGDRAPAGTAITSKDDNNIQQQQEKRNAQGTDRLTKDPSKGLKIDMGNGKVIEDKRPFANTPEQAYRDSGYGDPDKPLGQAKQAVEQVATTSNTDYNVAKAGAVVETQAKIDEALGQKLEAAPIPKSEQKAGAEAASRQLFSQGSLYADGLPRRPDDVIAQVRPSKEATHEAVMTGLGHLHGVVNFTANTLIGIGDTVRMASAAERKIDAFQIGQKDIDPEGTKKLHDTCQGLAMGSRVLLQYSTTLNKESPFNGKDFDPEARQAAERLSKEMPEKLKQEISQYKKSDSEERAAKSTELLLDIYTCAEAGGFVLSKAGQIAKDSKVMTQISHDMQKFATKLKELPDSETMSKMSEYLDKSMPKFGPELASDGPSLKQVKETKNEAEEQNLKMVKHSDRGKPHERGGDKARESKKLDEMREAHRITQEGWAETHEKKTVKYIRDKGEVIDKNKLEGTFPDDSPYRRQTDGMQWELKSMSKVEKSKNIVDAVLAHAKDGADKFTGKEQFGRVLIDAREQRWMTEKLAEDAIKLAIKRTPKLNEIRIVGKEFDMALKRGQRVVTRK